MVKRENQRNVVIEEGLWRRLRLEAVRRDRALKDILSEAIEQWLDKFEGVEYS